MDKAQLQEFERRCIQEEPAECVASCPLHVDARSFVIAVAGGAWDEAWRILRKTMPLPAVLGRICDHPCELRCKRGELGDPIRIGALERACVGTPVAEQRIMALPLQKKRVAVVGSGLSGLAAAWDLGRKGWPVTIFERSHTLGGLLAGFSEEELPRAVMNNELATLKKLRVEFRLGDVASLAELRRDFDAVFVGLDVDGDEPDLAAAGPIDPTTMQTGWHDVFVGGGAITVAEGASTHRSPIKWALDGRRGAVSIDRFLLGVSMSAGREKEGPQSTRLFVSLAVRELSPAVVPNPGPRDYTLGEARREADRCLRCECLECVKVCEYLDNYGAYPRRYARDIYNNASFVHGDHKANILIDSCMLCDLCTTVCPEDFSMPDLCLSARRDMFERGKMPPSAHEFALEDYRWSHGEAFAFSRHQPGANRSAYVFFPGCQLPASNPGQVEQVYEYLRSRLSGGVGLMLDCCGAPAHWAGRQELFERGVSDIAERWEELGWPTVIFACPTCLTLLKTRLPEARTIFFTQVVEEVGLPAAVDDSVSGPATGESPPSLRALHDPCTTRHQQGVLESVRRVLARAGQPVEELALSREMTECCGWGGLESTANPELAKRVAVRRAAESALEFVTYCAVCRDNLAAVGKRTVHLLDILFPGEQDSAARPRPGWSERRENRARLRSRLLSTVWQEGGPHLEPWLVIELLISPEVRDLLEVRRILVEDLQQVIHHAETTGEKLCHSGTRRFKACYRPRAVTFWVEYSLRGSTYEVHDAYSHRMTAVKGTP